MKNFLRSIFYLTLVLNSDVYSQPIHLLTAEDTQEPRVLTSPISPEKIRLLEDHEKEALYRTGLNVIASDTYASFKMRFGELQYQEQGVVFSYFISLFAERLGLQGITLVSEGSDMDSKSTSYVLRDNRLTSEFIMSIRAGTIISWEMFLGSSPAETVRSLGNKLEKPEFLTGTKEYIDLKELNSSERKLLIGLYLLNLLKNSKGSDKESSATMIGKLEENQSFSDSLQSLNPYHQYLKDVDITGLSFADYVKFFTHETIIKLSTTLYVTSVLFKSGIDSAGSLGQLTDILREFINCFLANKFNEKDPVLFSLFVNLRKDFPDSE